MKNSSACHGEFFSTRTLRNAFAGALMINMAVVANADPNTQGFYNNTDALPQYSGQDAGLDESHVYHRVETFDAYDRLFSHEETLPQIQQLLDAYGGIYFGDTHTDYNAAFFMTQQMEFFADSGVTHLFVELGNQDQTELFERFNAGIEGSDQELYDALEPRWRKYGAFESRMQMLYAARDNGIEILPIDVADRSDYPASRDLHDQWAAPILAENLDESRYLVFGGDLHASNLSNTGVAQILDIARLRIDSTLGLLYLNVSFEPDTAIISQQNYDDGRDFYLAHSVHPQHVINTLIARYGYREELELANDLICELDHMLEHGVANDDFEDIILQLQEIMEGQNHGSVRQLYSESVISAIYEISY